VRCSDRRPAARGGQAGRLSYFADEKRGSPDSSGLLAGFFVPHDSATPIRVHMVTFVRASSECATSSSCRFLPDLKRMSHQSWWRITPHARQALESAQPNRVAQRPHSCRRTPKSD